jgi:aminomethyltransferase
MSEPIITAAHQQAILVDRSQLGMLKITGATRLDLLHRMSTQKLNTLQTGQGAATVLTSDIARIIDRLILYVTSDSVYALTGENHADAIARYLMRFVFFNDDFQMQDVSTTTAVFAVYGPQASHYLTQAGFPTPDLPKHHWQQATAATATAYLHRTDPLFGDGWLVTCTTDDQPIIWQQLLSSGLPVADADSFEFLRIAAGQPRLGHELTLDYIPLEANLWEDVSFSKGCYIGQEIIARMESRGKLAKRLVRLQADQPLTIGAEITAVGKNAGTITSAATLAGLHVGLGFAKTAVLDAQTPLFSGEIPLTIQS